MKKVALLALIFLFFDCSRNENNNDCFPSINFNQIVNLDLPQFIDLQVPGGYVTTILGNRNLLIIRRTSNFQAFDLQCPDQSCSQSMTFDGLKMTCPCDGFEYNSLNGAPQSSGANCFAKEYLVQSITSSTLRISNF